MMHMMLKLREAARRVYRAQFGYPMATFGGEGASRHALLAYLPDGLFWKDGDPRFQWHQSLRQSRDLARLLSSRGFSVDVVHYDDPDFSPSRHYNLVIAHPGVVSRRLQSMPKNGVRLCLRTGKHAEYIDRVMAERYAKLCARRACSLSWPGMGETNEVYRGYDAIACFDGDGSTARTFVDVGIPVYPFRNFANPDIEYVAKDFREARRGFVYMAGHLHLLKGLDWILEEFGRSSVHHLYVCGKLSSDIKRLYKNELKRSNIHCLGFVHYGSSQFERICQRAAWYISATASEGCQGTALDWMAAGMVPIVSDASGVDVKTAGIRLSPCSPETLGAALQRTVNYSVMDLQRLSREARSVVESNYSMRHFVEDWRHILDRVEAVL